jgi:Arc/MetJ-type ribon-helix-helix transcriptional regulator
MSTVRLNITLPTNLAEAIKEKRNKSAFIKEAIEERLAMERKEKLKAALQEGYLVTKKEDKEISSEWDSTSGDGIA